MPQTLFPAITKFRNQWYIFIKRFGWAVVPIVKVFFQFLFFSFTSLILKLLIYLPACVLLDYSFLVSRYQGKNNFGSNLMLFWKTLFMILIIWDKWYGYTGNQVL